MKTIYFVHDSQESPSQRRQILEMAGYTVECFTSGAACLEAMENSLPALILMDILIEGPNGFETTRRIREDFTPNDVPILLTSKIYRSRQFREEARASGAQGYLLRPLDLDAMVRDVGTLCGEVMAPRGEAAA